MPQPNVDPIKINFNNEPGNNLMKDLNRINNNLNKFNNPQHNNEVNPNR
jgi:hypothetical protein